MIEFIAGVILGALGGMIVVTFWAIRTINDLRQENLELKVDLLHK